MNIEDRRALRLQLQDDHIGRAMREIEASGELRTAPSWGKPQASDVGWDEAPPELRMAFKILKDAGVVPPEIEALREVAALRASLVGAPEGDEDARRRRQRMIDLQQLVALRLEKLGRGGTL